MRFKRFLVANSWLNNLLAFTQLRPEMTPPGVWFSSPTLLSRRTSYWKQLPSSFLIKNDWFPLEYLDRTIFAKYLMSFLHCKGKHWTYPNIVLLHFPYFSPESGRFLPFCHLTCPNCLNDVWILLPPPFSKFSFVRWKNVNSYLFWVAVCPHASKFQWKLIKKFKYTNLGLIQ